MRSYAAAFCKELGEQVERLAVRDLAASTLQSAIDEARLAARDLPEASLVKIYADGDLVESVGVGPHPFRT